MKTYDEYVDDVRKQQQDQKDKDIANQKALYEANKTVVTDTYNAQIADTNDSYGDLHRKNETQRLLNQRYIERKAAEMGLTDSGFNRTQQTASQLAYSNQQGEYFRQQQKAVDTLALTMKNKLTELETTMNTNINAIEEGYEKSAIQTGAEMYNTALKLEEEAKVNYQNKVNDLSSTMMDDDISLNEKYSVLQNSGLEEADFIYLSSLAQQNYSHNQTKANTAAANTAKKEYQSRLSNLESKMLDKDLDVDKKAAMLKRADLEAEDWDYLVALGGEELREKIDNTALSPTQILIKAANTAAGFRTYY